MRRVRLRRPDHQRPAGPPVDAAGHHRPRVRRPDPRRSGRPSATSPIGARVVVDPDPKCGACDSCRAGRPANCTNIVALGVHRDGALARFVTDSGQQRLPDLAEDVPAEMAALVEPLACVVNGTNRAAIRPGESAVVFGAGRDRLPVHRRLPGVRARRGSWPSSRARAGRRSRAAVGADVVVTPDEWAAQRDRAHAGRRRRRGRRGRQRPAPGDRGGRDGRPGRHLRHERERPPAGPPDRDRREGPDDPRLVHLATSRSRPRSGSSRAASSTSPR